MVVSIFVFAVLGTPDLPLRIASRIVLIPFIAGISYEIIRFNGRHADWWWVKVVAWPSLLLQNMTTKQPDDGQCEVAIASIQAAIALDNGETISTQTSVPSDPEPSSGASTVE